MCTVLKEKKIADKKNQQIQLKFDHTAYQFFFVVSKRRKFRLGKMYKLLGITQSKLRTYGNGNHFNYLGNDHLILRGRGGGLENFDSSEYLFSIFCGPKIILSPTSGQIIPFRL